MPEEPAPTMQTSLIGRYLTVGDVGVNYHLEGG